MAKINAWRYNNERAPDAFLLSADGFTLTKQSSITKRQREVIERLKRGGWSVDIEEDGTVKFLLDNNFYQKQRQGFTKS